jgi:hypothetical protein
MNDETEKIDKERRAWYRRNLRTLELLSLPVLDKVCEWIYHRWYLAPEPEENEICAGWKIFADRTRAAQKGIDRPWQDFLMPHPKWGSFQNGEMALNEPVIRLSGPILESEQIENTGDLRIYSVDMGYSLGPLAAEGGILEVTVFPDGSVSCRSLGMCWRA